MNLASSLAPLRLRLAMVGVLSTSALAQLGPPPEPPQNPTTPEKAVLGKILFWDEAMSSDNTVACGTCHIPSSGGADPRTGLPEARHPGPDGQLGTIDDIFGTLGVMLSNSEDEYVESGTFGFERQVTTRQSPSFIGAAYFNSNFWDGSASTTFRNPLNNQVVIPVGGGLESQAVGPPTSDVEMAHQARDWSEITAKLEVVEPLSLASNLPADIVTALAINPTYPELFENAFGTTNITPTRIAFALASYQRTLVPNQTRFDLGTMTPGQQAGFNFFQGQARCDVCHQPPLFSDRSFRNIGVRPPAEDLGRQIVTGNNGDRGRFKVPSLRNVGLRNSFFHTGHVRPGQGAPMNSLEAVIAFYDRGGDFADNRDPLLNGTNVPNNVRPALLDFLRNALTDPRVENELFPFDRPNLASEAPGANPNLIGTGTVGSGLFIPHALVSSPPIVGTPGFRVGVASGLGGATAHLMLVGQRSGGSAIGPFSPITPVRRSPLATIVLDGSGQGQGFGTVHLDLAQIPALAVPGVNLQWMIEDPAAMNGMAKSERIELNLLF